MKRSVKIKQHDITDCGAACLASVAAYYGLRIPVSRIRQYASTDQKGTNVLGLIEAAARLGFTAKGVKGPFESLFNIPMPAIAHIILKNKLQHYVVIYKITKKYVLMMDPGSGKLLRKSHSEFKKEWTGVLILIVPDQEFETGNEISSPVKRFVELIRPHKTVMAQAFFGAVIYSLLGLSTSVYVEKIVDYVLIDGNLNLLNLLSVTMIVLLLLRVYVGIMKGIFALKTGQKIDAALILGYYKHLMKLPQRFFDTMRTGEIISRINDAVKIRVFINNIALDMLVNVLVVLFTFGLMLIYFWKLALVLLIAIPLYVLTYFIYNKLNKKYLRKNMENTAELESQLVESINASSTIKQFGLEDYSNLKTETKFIKLLGTTYHSVKYSILSVSFTTFIAGTITISILWIGSRFVVNQQMTPGELMSFYALTGYILAPLASLIDTNRVIQDAMIAADRLFQIMDLEREEKVSGQIDMSEIQIGNIYFKNVSFRYGSRVTVFTDLNLTIRKEKLTAIVGESGSGKTTLMSLLQNIYPIQSGTIEIGKYNIGMISNASLREMVGVVPQRIDLFAGSIAENIAVGELEPDMRRIVDICHSLGLIKLIEKLPGGFSAWVGENGVSLSGGERQRIAIARAIYKNPQILILDEATSSLDSESEQYVQQTLKFLKDSKKTVIIIAHRLSTIMNADEIIVLSEGKVIETGTHKELLNKKERYYHLWKQQVPVFENVL
jgi:ATP-binding cassette subfamily B protein